MFRPAFHTALLIMEQTLPPHGCLGSFLEMKEFICLKLQLHGKVFLERLQVPAHHQSPVVVLTLRFVTASLSQMDGGRDTHPVSPCYFTF